MTVAENIRVAVGREHLRRRDPDATKAMRALLDDVGFLGHLEDRVGVAQRRPDATCSSSPRRSPSRRGC